jgi:predicted secreted protein
MTDVDLDSIFEQREQVKKSGVRKALPWLIGAGVVAAAIAGMIIVFGTNTGESTNTPLSTLAADDRSVVPGTVKLEPEARRVARRFIETAVARKNLKEAYALAGPQIVQGQSLKDWMTGNIAVIPYPVDSIDYAPMKIDYSYPNEALIEVALLPTDKAQKEGTKSQLFMAGLKKIKGKWVVDQWTPRSSPPVPNGSGNNGG